MITAFCAHTLAAACGVATASGAPAAHGAVAAHRSAWCDRNSIRGRRAGAPAACGVATAHGATTAQRVADATALPETLGVSAAHALVAAGGSHRGAAAQGEPVEQGVVAAHGRASGLLPARPAPGLKLGLRHETCF